MTKGILGIIQLINRTDEKYITFIGGKTIVYEIDGHFEEIIVNKELLDAIINSDKFDIIQENMQTIVKNKK